MKLYERPQAHHWIILRLLRTRTRDKRICNMETSRSIVWLMRTLGRAQVFEMIDALNFEEQNK